MLILISVNVCFILFYNIVGMSATIHKERERENICIINNELFTWRLILIATFRWRQRER